MTKLLKLIIISDGTGETASSLARAVSTQFKEQDVLFTRFKSVRSREQIDSIFETSVTHHDMVLHTVVSAELRNYITLKAKRQHVRVVDLMGDLITAFSNYFKQEPLSKPGLHHAVDDTYFQRVAAMEFTLNHDDGRHLDSLHMADVVLVGISRTSKTPLSMYLSLQGLKVMNVPIIPGVPAPDQIFQIDQRKVFALTIDPEYLMQIRKNRLGSLGAGTHQGEYASYDKILNEVEWANGIFKENKKWMVFNVTGKAVEETAAEILRILNRRKNNPFNGPKKL